jgi:undecaprenyl diphosphate synthase
MLTCTAKTPDAPALAVPNSICFTPDKNRTWAQSFGLPALMGHSKGRDVADTVINDCFAMGIRDVVFWAMSESNIHKRSKDERAHLVKLLKEELRRHEKEDRRIGFRLCGKWQRVIADEELETLVKEAHERTTNYHNKRLTVLFGYNGMTDILQAASRVAEKFGPEGCENSDLIRSHMWIGHLPERIDMLVRTGVNPKNRHNSDSLLPLHGQQAFVYDVEAPWPQFTTELLRSGIENFAHCIRAKGA